MKFWCTENPLRDGGDSDSVKSPCLFGSWSLIHLLWGFFLYCILLYKFKKISKGMAIMMVILIHTIYEITDMFYYLGFVGDGLWSNNSPLNSIGDTIACLSGSLSAMILFKKINKNILKIVGGLTIAMNLFFVMNYCQRTSKQGCGIMNKFIKNK